MEQFRDKILIAILVVTMAISGIAPSVMSVSHVVQASEMEGVGIPTPEPTPEPTEEPTVTQEPTETPTPEPTPEASVTPEVSGEPEENTPSVTPEITPSVTPKPTPGLSIGLFSVEVPSEVRIVDGYTIDYIIDVSDNTITTITDTGIQVEGGAFYPYASQAGGHAIEVTGDGQGIVRVNGTNNYVLVFNGVKSETPSGAGTLDGKNASSSPVQIGYRTSTADTSAGAIAANATIHLAAGTSNRLVCNGTSGSAAVLQSAIAVVRASNLTIKGTGTLTAISGYYAAAIGGGANRGCGNITITSGTVEAITSSNTATSGANNGAGIGGGGGNSAANTGAIGKITINGTAKVTATSSGSGAGIGSAGTNQGNNTQNGGIVEISGAAEVIATSNGRGAGIGSGGVGTTPATRNCGTITISGNTKVTATSKGSGAGIGGGGATTGLAGDGGTITISGSATEAPIVVASGGQDLGAGKNSNGIAGTAVTIIIDGGNVYANGDKSDIVRNSAGDELGRADIMQAWADVRVYQSIGAANTYSYYAKRDDNNNAYIWLPLGNQLVVHRFREKPVTADFITTTTQVMPNGILTTVAALVPGDVSSPPELTSDYRLLGAEKEIAWTTGKVLPTIVYEYIRNTVEIRDVYALNAEGDNLVYYKIGDRLGSGSPNLSDEEAYITGPVTIAKGGVYHVKTYATVAGKIFVNTTQEVVIVLDGTSWVNATGDSDSSMRLGTNAKVKLVVMDGSINSFINTVNNVSTDAKTAGIYVPANPNSNQIARLTITGGMLSNVIGNYQNSGTLLAQSFAWSAGIGGGPNQHAGEINIWGGEITAHAGKGGTGAGNGNGAGIGGGGGNTSGGGKSIGGINICGQAKVKAISEEHGAGIGGAGGGYNSAAVNGVAAGPSDGGKITISGSDKVKVEAISKGNGAGIGGGGRSVAVNTNPSAPGIAGGDGGIITIKGSATVTATSEDMGAGIGGAGALAYSAGKGGTITISDTATVIATGGSHGAGIGGGGVKFPTGEIPTGSAGMGGVGGTISIIGNAHVEAKSNGRGAGIGGGGADNGYGGNSNYMIFGDDIVIHASSTTSGAGIGGGGGTRGAGSAEAIIIKDRANITASAGDGDGTLGSPMGAGIGGGGSAQGTAGNAKSLTISGKCYVEAISGGSGGPAGGGGAAIGGGGSVDSAGTPGNGGDVTIANDGIPSTDPATLGKLTGTPTVIANGNPIGMDFGYGIKPNTGEKGAEGKLTITSGNVWAKHENTPLATNGQDVVKMRRAPHDDCWDGTAHVKPATPTLLRYDATGAIKPTYQYTAWTHANTNDGWAYVWKPSDIIDIDLDMVDPGKIYVPDTGTMPITSRPPVEIDGEAARQGSSFVNVDNGLDFDDLAEAIKIEWIRVSTYDTNTYGERNSLYDINSFDGKFAELKGAGSSNCGTIAAGAGLNPDGTFHRITQQNGTIWFKVTFGNKTGLTGDDYFEAGTGFHSFRIENYYTIIEVLARDVTVSLGPTRELISTGVPNGYIKMLNAGSGVTNPNIYGIPLDFIENSVTPPIVKGIKNAQGIFEPTYGYDEVQYISYDFSALLGNKLRLPTPFDEISEKLVLDKEVAGNVDTDTTPPVVTDGPNGAGSPVVSIPSTIYKKYYRMDYIKSYVLTVKKVVRGEFANTAKKFTFTAIFTEGPAGPRYTDEIGWEITDASGIVDSGSMNLADNGEHQFDLKHGQRIDFFSFAMDASPPAAINIVENDYSSDGYTTSYTSEKVRFIVDGNGTPVEQPPTIIPETPGRTMNDDIDGNLEVTFINTRDTIVPSAVEVSDSSFFGPAIAILELMILAALLVRYRKVKQQRAISKHFRKQ